MCKDVCADVSTYLYLGVLYVIVFVYEYIVYYYVCMYVCMCEYEYRYMYQRTCCWISPPSGAAPLMSVSRESSLYLYQLISVSVDQLILGLNDGILLVKW